MTGRLVVLLFLLQGDACAQLNTGSVVMTGRVRADLVRGPFCLRSLYARCADCERRIYLR